MRVSERESKIILYFYICTKNRARRMFEYPISLVMNDSQKHWVVFIIYCGIFYCTSIILLCVLQRMSLLKNEMYSEWDSCLHDSLRILCESIFTSVTFFIVSFLVAMVFCVLLV